MVEDTVLLRAYAVEHADDAFAQLVARHLDAVYSAALRRVGYDPQLAQDVTQQVFVALARQARPLSDHPLLSAWLYRTTRNQASKTVRSERRRKACEQAALALSLNVPEPAHDAAWSRVAPLLDAAVDRLRPADRVAVVLRFIERQSYATIAARLAISEDAARMRVDRALEQLRATLARAGISSTAAALGTVLSAHAVTAAPAGLAEAVAGATTTGAIAGSTTVLAGVIEFMTTTKAVGTAVAALALATAGTLTYEVVQYRDAQQAVADARAGLSGAASTRIQARSLSERAVGALLTLGRQFSRQSAALRDPAAVAQRAGFSPAAAEAGRKFLARHPEIGRAVDDYCRAKVRLAWEPVLRRRHLTPEQIAQVIEFELSAPAQSTVLKIGSRAIAGPDGEPMIFTAPGAPDEAGLQTLRQSLQAWGGLDVASQVVREMPGHSDEQALGRTIARTLAQGLWFGPEPLRADQAEKVAALVAENIRVSDLAYDGDAILAGAKTFLSPAQLAFLDGLNARAAFETAITRAVQTAEDSAKTEAPPS